jgi:hypothetical protein
MTDITLWLYNSVNSKYSFRIACWEAINANLWNIIRIIIRMTLHVWWFSLCLSPFTKVLHTIPFTPYPLRGSRGILDTSMTLKDSTEITAIRNTADMTGGKPIRRWAYLILGVNTVNTLIVFYCIYRKEEVLFFCSVSDTTRDLRYPWNKGERN